MEIPILKGSARISSRLNFVCPQLFPSSGFWSVKPANDVMENDKVGSSSLYNTLNVELLLVIDVNIMLIFQSTSLEACGIVSAQNLLKVILCHHPCCITRSVSALIL